MSDKIEQLRSLLKSKKSKSFYAKKLKISIGEVDDLLNEIRKDNTLHNVDKEVESDNQLFREHNIERGILKSSIVTDYEPKSIEELISLHKIDVNKYRVSQYWTKQRGEKFTSSLLCTAIKSSDFSEDKFIEFLSTYKAPSISIKSIQKNKESKETVDVEISIADFHLDKLTIDEDSIDDRRKKYMEILISLVSKVYSCYYIRKIVFVIGNDFYHTDNYHNSTTNLTPQDVAVPFNVAYEKGFDLMVQAISFLKESCDFLDVMLIQGNHDRTKSFYLAHALEVFFKNESNIKFKREHSTTKYTVLGDTFIGYHHGNTKIDDLPLIFATSADSSAQFGLRRYREIHTGDKHFYLVKEIKGVRIQQLPSLSGTDRWHLDNNYINNIRAALALVYHPTKGKIAEFEERI